MAHIGSLGHGGSSLSSSLSPELATLRAALASPIRSPGESDQLLKALDSAMADGAFDTTELTFSAKLEIDKPDVWSALLGLARARGATRFIAFGDTATRMAAMLGPPLNHLELRRTGEKVDLTALPECIGQLTVDPARASDIRLPRELVIHVLPHADAAAVAASTVTVVGADGVPHGKPLAPPAPPAHAVAGAAAAGVGDAGPAAGGPVAPHGPSPDDKRGGARDAAVLRITGSVPKKALGHPPGTAYCVVDQDDAQCSPFGAMAPMGCAGAVAALPAGQGTLVVLPMTDKEGRVIYSLDGAVIRACRERGIQIQVYAKSSEQATAAVALRSRWERDLTDQLRQQDSHDVRAAMENPLFQSYAREKDLTEALDMWPDVQAWERSAEPDRAAFQRMQATVLADTGIFIAALRNKLRGVDAATASADTLRALGDEIVRAWAKQAGDDARQWRFAQNRLHDADVVVRDAKAPEPGISAIGNLNELGKFLADRGQKDKLPALALYKLCFDYQRARGNKPLQSSRWDALARATGQLAPMKARINAALRGVTFPSAAADEVIVGLMANAKRQLDDVLEAFESAHPDGVYRRDRV